MESALIVTPFDSCAEKKAGFFGEMLDAAGFNKVVTLDTIAEARRLLLKQDFDLVIVNSPLPDESGESFARQIAAGDRSEVILIVKEESFGAVSAACEDVGVFAIAKPVNKAVFRAALLVARSAHGRLRRLREENAKLKQKLEDIGIINRAKFILISYHKMSEQEAHRFIEKQAMDMRAAKRVIAEGILKTYEN
jgi:response regulator NasT